MLKLQTVLKIRPSIYNCFKPQSVTRICVLYNDKVFIKNALLCHMNRNYANYTVDDKNVAVRNKQSNLNLKDEEMGNVSDKISTTKLTPQHRKRKSSHLEILKLYPQPLSALQNIYQVVCNEMGDRHRLKLVYHKKSHTTEWICTCTVYWPEEKTFSIEGTSKQIASTHFAIQCLEWLHNLHMIKNKKPILMNQNKVKDITQTFVDIDIEPNDMQEMQSLLNVYDENIKSIISSAISPNTSVENSLSEDISRQRVTTEEVSKGNNSRGIERGVPTVKLMRRNQKLLEKLHERKGNYQTDLPIYHYKERILAELDKNQVLLIKGDTGCGKTTQVPQFLMDAFTEKGMATDCNMIISQPRRISATSIAMRIAQERNENLGDVVGYRVRLEKIATQDKGSMLFCTTGILLRMLQDDPTLKNYSHVILDEAHERNTETDMLLALLKRSIQKNPSLKLIVMSATLNADLFQNYFNCDAVDVPGRLHPVTTHFLEDMEEMSIVSNYYKNGHNGHLDVSELCTQMVEAVEWISMRKPPGAILCFLPGWAEINLVQKKLASNLIMAPSRLIVAAHSKLSTTNQRMIFDPPPSHIRKIILSTDIAETGITVPDVRYVVDSCIHRDMCWHDSIMLPSIDNLWVSQANIHQRKGRAGRVQPGESYHLINQNTYDQLSAHPVPEILRTSLDEPILEIMGHKDMSVRDFLNGMPDPPNAKSIDNSINSLKTLGAINEEEQLTPLGKRMAHLGINPRLGKAMVYSTIFRCVDPIVGISSLFAKDNDIFSEILTDKPAVRRTKRIYHPSSDHLALYWLYITSRQYENDPQQMREFCRKLLLNFRKLEIITKEIGVNTQHLQRSKMMYMAKSYESIHKELNRFSLCDELLRAVLFSGTNLVLHQKNYGFKKGILSTKRTELRGNNGIKMTITTDSVNYKRKFWPSTFLTYVQGQHSVERRTTLVRETSILTPLSIILFAQKVFQSEQQATNNQTDRTKVALTVESLRNVQLTCDRETAQLLLKVRETMWSIVDYLVKTQGICEVLQEDELEEVRSYNGRFLNLLSKMLTTAATPIQQESVDTSFAEDDND